MPDSESSSVPITKQFISVTRRPVPAPARMRPPGRKRKPSSASRNRESSARDHGLGLGERARDAVERRVDRRLVLEPVARAPDVLGERVRERGRRGGFHADGA
jgi:hypothetical protein